MQNIVTNDCVLKAGELMQRPAMVRGQQANFAALSFSQTRQSNQVPLGNSSIQSLFIFFSQLPCVVCKFISFKLTKVGMNLRSILFT